jgi:pimeloyl-ACP methyl ester carboxylesterase
VKWKNAALLGAAGAAVGLAAVGAVNLWGRRVRSIRDELRDDPLNPPEDVEHVYFDTVDDGVLHVVVTGAGPPVVLLHGVTLQWWVWSAVIRLLRSDHRVIAWDMRGHGESKAGTRGVTLEACADDLAQILIELEATDAVVVGHSMGGMVLGRFVIQNHEVAHSRVRGLVFLATSAAPASIAGLRGGMAALASLAEPLARRDVRRSRTSYPWKDTNVSAALARTAFGRNATARMVDDTRLMIAATPSATLAEAASSIAAHDVRAELASVDLPTVVVVGSLDALTPPPHARALAEVVSGSELRVLRGVGHQVMQEDPAAIEAAIDHFDQRG